MQVCFSLLWPLQTQFAHCNQMVEGNLLRDGNDGVFWMKKNDSLNFFYFFNPGAAFHVVFALVLGRGGSLIAEFAFQVDSELTFFVVG